ncbi:MAG: helix-turn-helix domain-containing protein [Nocardioidaceae bacterium]
MQTPSEPPRGHPDAIVRPRQAEQLLTVERMSVGEALAPYVDYLWYVGWRLDEPHEQQVVPQPRIHVAAEDGRLLVHGIGRSTFTRRLVGTGHTLGASFLPGGFRCLLGSSVGALSDRVLPAADVLGVDDRPAAAAVLGSEDRAEMATALEGYLAGLDPVPDPVAVQVRELVARAETDRSVTRAEALARLAGVSLRTLQRLFTEYVGTGPKWVIQRYRILDAAAAAHGGEPVDWAALAAELGFSDQAHLTRVFTQVVGTPPASYRRGA